MKELITEVTSASISGGPIPVTTDEIASHYERRLSQSISMKILASQNGPSPVFTKEEMAYLNRKASEESQLSEVKVITPDPTITLKKGNTEINIRNAATLVKKMEEIYPSPNRSVEPELSSEEIDELVDELAEESKREQEEPVRQMTARGEAAMREQFQRRVNKLATTVSPEVARYVAPDEKTFQERFGDVKTVNKNAYEIRADILAMALDWVKFKKEATGQLATVADDDVLTAAQKFYKFVENRR